MSNLNYEKRDLLMVGGSIFFILGLLPLIGLAPSMAIGVAIFFGVKMFVKKRRESMLGNIGDGICADCGSPLRNQKCPNCNPKK